MKIDGISFNDQWVKDHSEDEFVKEFMPMEHIFEGSDNKEQQLREAYRLHFPEKKQSLEIALPDPGESKNIEDEEK